MGIFALIDGSAGCGNHGSAAHGFTVSHSQIYPEVGNRTGQDKGEGAILVDGDTSQHIIRIPGAAAVSPGNCRNVPVKGVCRGNKLDHAGIFALIDGGGSGHHGSATRRVAVSGLQVYPEGGNSGRKFKGEGAVRVGGNIRQFRNGAIGHPTGSCLGPCEGILHRNEGDGLRLGLDIVLLVNLAGSNGNADSGLILVVGIHHGDHKLVNPGVQLKAEGTVCIERCIDGAIEILCTLTLVAEDHSAGPGILHGMEGDFVGLSGSLGLGSSRDSILEPAAAFFAAGILITTGYFDFVVICVQHRCAHDAVNRESIRFPLAIDISHVGFGNNVTMSRAGFIGTARHRKDIIIVLTIGIQIYLLIGHGGGCSIVRLIDVAAALYGNGTDNPSDVIGIPQGKINRFKGSRNGETNGTISVEGKFNITYLHLAKIASQECHTVRDFDHGMEGVGFHNIPKTGGEVQTGQTVCCNVIICSQMVSGNREGFLLVILLHCPRVHVPAAEGIIFQYRDILGRGQIQSGAHRNLNGLDQSRNRCLPILKPVGTPLIAIQFKTNEAVEVNLHGLVFRLGGFALFTCDFHGLLAGSLGSHIAGVGSGADRADSVHIAMTQRIDGLGIGGVVTPLYGAGEGSNTLCFAGGSQGRFTYVDVTMAGIFAFGGEGLGRYVRDYHQERQHQAEETL